MQAFFSHKSPPLAALHLITFLVGKAEWFECNSKEAASKKDSLFLHNYCRQMHAAHKCLEQRKKICLDSILGFLANNSSFWLIIYKVVKF